MFPCGRVAMAAPFECAVWVDLYILLYFIQMNNINITFNNINKKITIYRLTLIITDT